MKIWFWLVLLWIVVWSSAICNVHCQCIDTVGHVAKECEPKWNTFYETYPDSSYQVNVVYWECICKKCNKKFNKGYTSIRKVIWKED